MQNDDMTLLREFAGSNSEEAFAVLVSRHVGMVYSVALRQAGDPHLAEEVAQAVFIILARKAGSLGPKTILPGWLCRTARHVSANALTMQRRRQRREQEAYMQSLVNEPNPEEWRQIAPLLEGAMEKLGQKDHDAVVLRFFKGLNFKEVGAAMGASEAAAKMRVSRALEKLRKCFTKRGVISTTALIAAAISANSIQAAPAALAKSVTAAAVTQGAAAGGSTLTLVKGALKLMPWTKAKSAMTIGLGVLLVAGAGIGGVEKIKSNQADSACAGITEIKLTGTTGALFTGWYTRDGKTTFISNAVPWSFTAARLSSFEIHKLNEEGTIRVALAYDGVEAHATMNQTLDSKAATVNVQVKYGFYMNLLPK